MERTDIYRKYDIKRTDGELEPEAIYFVLRLDRKDHWWDSINRWAVRHIARRLIGDYDLSKHEFGLNLEEWVNELSFKEDEKRRK